MGSSALPEAVDAQVLLGALFDRLQTGLCLFDAEDRIILWNAAFPGFFPEAAARLAPGMTYLELVRCFFEANLPASEQPALDRHLRAAVDRQRDRQGRPYVYQRRDGRWIAVQPHPLPDGSTLKLWSDVTAEQTGQAEQTRLRDVILAIDIGLAQYDAGDRFILANHTLWSLFPESIDLFSTGVPYAEHLRRYADSSLAESERPRLERLIGRASAAAQPVAVPEVFRRRGGGWVQLEERPSGDGGLTSLWLDVTARIGAEAELDRLRSRLRDAIDSIEEGFVLFDAEDRIVLSNRAYAELYGHDPADIAPGNTFEDELHRGLDRGIYGELGYDAVEWIAARLARHRTPRAPFEIRLNSGRWVRVAERPTADGGIVGLHSDITALKRREDELRRARETLEDAIQALADGFALYDAEDRLVLCNQRYRDLNATTTDLLVPGMRWSDALRIAAERGQFADAIGRVEEWCREREAQRRTSGESFEVPLSDGRWLRVADWRTRQGGMVGIRTDITDLKRREQELARRPAMLDAVCYGASQLIGREDWRDGIAELLGRLGEATRASRAYLVETRAVAGRGPGEGFRCEWTAPGIASAIDDPGLHDIAAAATDEGDRDWMRRRQQGEVVQAITRDLSGYLRETLERQEVRSLVTVPVMVRGEWWGTMGFDDCAAERVWSELELDVLRTAAGLIAGALERARIDEELRVSEERYALAAEGANDGLWDGDLEHRRAYYSPRLHDMLGLPPGALGNSPDSLLHRCHPDDAERCRRSLQALGDNTDRHYVQEFRLLHADGSYRWVLARGLAVRDEEGALVRIAGSISDITERKRIEEQLLHDAVHDSLTGLPNRALFMDRLGQAIERAERNGKRLSAVLVIDLDRFKTVNDSLGHASGDRLLVAVARRLDSLRRPGDTIARLGGDEFAVLIEGIAGAEAASAFARRCQEALAMPMRLSGHDVIVTASIGIALIADGSESAFDLLRNADEAMYHAKNAGKAQHVQFDETMHVTIVRRLAMETALHSAVEQGQIELHYQPILSLPGRRVAGFEALARWHHPVRGMVPPAEFIPIAEETGMIVRIGAFALAEAAPQLRDWSGLVGGPEPLTMSVNVSSRQLFQPGDLDLLLRVLDESGVPGQLKLEITESVIMANPDEAAAILDRVKATGILLSLDDFGTGYSSFSYLHRFPFDILKIDRSFISRITQSRKNLNIVRAIIGLAQDLGMEVVAEGIETEAECDALDRLGCQYGQGFLFARPLPAAAALDYLRRSAAQPLSPPPPPSSPHDPPACGTGLVASAPGRG